MRNLISQCEAHIAKYSGHVSSFFLTFMVVAVCGFISPALLYAAEINSRVDNPVPTLQEFRQEKPKIMKVSATGTMMVTSSRQMMENQGAFSTSSQEKIIQYRNARIQKTIAALLALEKSSANLRLELEKIQNSPTSSTSTINLGQVQKKINELLNQFKKTNFNTEFSRIKSELNSEQSKRVVAEKKETEKRQLEMRKEQNRLREGVPTSTVSSESSAASTTQ